MGGTMNKFEIQYWSVYDKGWRQFFKKAGENRQPTNLDQAKAQVRLLRKKWVEWGVGSQSLRLIEIHEVEDATV
jgi:hypothetical protein